MNKILFLNNHFKKIICRDFLKIGYQIGMASVLIKDVINNLQLLDDNCEDKDIRKMLDKMINQVTSANLFLEKGME